MGGFHLSSALRPIKQMARTDQLLDVLFNRRPPSRATTGRLPISPSLSLSLSLSLSRSLSLRFIAALYYLCAAATLLSCSSSCHSIKPTCLSFHLFMPTKGFKSAPIHAEIPNVFPSRRVRRSSTFQVRLLFLLKKKKKKKSNSTLQAQS